MDMTSKIPAIVFPKAFVAFVSERLFLTHNPKPMTNIVYNVAASSCLWVLKCVCKSCREGGSYARHQQYQRSCWWKRWQSSGFSACVVWKEPLVSLKEPHRVARAINSLIFSAESWLKIPPFPAHFLPTLHSAECHVLWQISHKCILAPSNHICLIILWLV